MKGYLQSKVHQSFCGGVGEKNDLECKYQLGFWFMGLNGGIKDLVVETTWNKSVFGGGNGKQSLLKMSVLWASVGVIFLQGRQSPIYRKRQQAYYIHYFFPLLM